MVNFNYIESYIKAIGVKHIVQTKPQEIHGIVPTLTYPPTGKKFELPRFCSIEMQQARIMNKIAIKNEYVRRSNCPGKKTTPEDLERLSSLSAEASKNRAVWINPKDNKAYYLLKEGETKKGNINLRILNQDGEFVKNAEIKPKTVILTDLAEGSTEQTSKFLTHTELINTIAERYNPFAKYKTVSLDLNKKGTNEINKLYRVVDNNTSCISMSFADIIGGKGFDRAHGEAVKDMVLGYMDTVAPKQLKTEESFNKLAKKTRILVGSASSGKNTINTYLAQKNLEGVGGLDSRGKIPPCISSRNSIFTQHYEDFEFLVYTTEEGLNITGLRGTDFPIKHNLGPHKYVETIAGTSFSAPIRSAKLALNEMMEGIL